MAPPIGFIPWNKGTIGIMKPNSGSFKKGARHSSKTEFKKGNRPINPIKKGERRGIATEFTREIVLGNKNNKWKGDNVGYFASHAWMQRTLGKAVFCDNKKNFILKFECSGESKRFEWAFKGKKGYSRNINSYLQLCKSCHVKYDRN